MESGSGRTRSQAAPEWTVQECLILINEIHAIESEWNHNLSSFQKWQLVVHNCASLDVNRSFNQCNRKWDSLQTHFRKIKPFESSYWAYHPHQRAHLGLPETFSAEVFQAIDNYFTTTNAAADDDDEQEDPVSPNSGPDTDPDCDPEDLRIHDVVLDTGFQKQRKRAVPPKRKIDKRLNPWRHVIGRKVNNEQHNLDGLIDPATSQINVKVKSAPGNIKNCLDDSVELPNSWAVSETKLEPSSVKVEEHSIATTLLENVKMINSILQGNLGEEDTDSQAATQIDFARLQGDKLIHHLGKFSNTLKQLSNHFQQFK